MTLDSYIHVPVLIANSMTSEINNKYVRWFSMPQFVETDTPLVHFAHLSPDIFALFADMNHFEFQC